MGNAIQRGLLGLLLACMPMVHAAEAPSIALNTVPVILFKGDATTAYRDPAALYHDKVFRLFFTLVRIEEGLPYSYLAWSKSSDLRTWTTPVILTPRDRARNYGSPGNIVRVKGEWILCLQTYPRPHGELYGNADARLWIMRSADLETWSEPELLRVKGPDVPREKMGRMIDPYLLEDPKAPGTWWCFYKQNGISMSTTTDFVTWRYVGRADAGENACVIADGDGYLLFHSPPNGIGMKRSNDLLHWRDCGIAYLGQNAWPWAQGRLTGGFVLDLRKEPSVGTALLFFHGSRYPESAERGFDNYASIGLAWSSDFAQWHWNR